MNSPSPKIVTSFRKKGSEIKTIRGTRVSTHNAQLLTSIGLSTLDFFIGGGIPIGTTCIIEEDTHDIVSRNIMKFFLSEGVVQNHQIFLSSGGKISSNLLINELPAARVIDMKNKSRENKAPDEKMKIAIQYQNQPPVQDAHFKVSYHNQGFDLSKRMSEESIKQCSITTWDPSQECQKPESIPNFLSCPYSHVLDAIKDKLISENLRMPSKACQTVMRIGICSLGSPLWNGNDSSNDEFQIIRFLYLLRALLRTSFAVAVITVPFYITQNKSLISRIRQTSDTVIGFESFEGTKLVDHLAFQDYAGLVHIRKLPILNSCIYPVKTKDLAYKTKRKELIIERLHLPPDLDDNPDEKVASACGGPCSSKLDY